MKKTMLAVAGLGALLAGCASPEGRIASQLMDYGLSRSQATCMAEEMADRLSGSQLRRLADAALSLKREGADLERMTVRDIMRRVNGLGDPEIVGVVTRAGIGCAVMNGGFGGLRL